MAVMLVVTDGVPDDLGKSLNLSELGGATLGRGVGASLRLADPAWHGRVRVERVAGVYRVTNEMGHTISLGEQNLPDGAAATWYNGVELQATADTCFALATDKESAADPLAADQKWRKAGSVGVILLALLVVPAVVFLDTSPPPGRPTSPEGVRRSFEAIVERLGKVERGPLAPVAAQARVELRAARFAELSRRDAEALSRYEAARAAIEGGLAARARAELPADEVKLLDAASAFASDRLVTLSNRVKSRR